MAVSIAKTCNTNETIFSSDAKKIRTDRRTIQKYYFVRQVNGERREGRTLVPFFENREDCPDFGEKGCDCVHLRINFSIQNVVLSFGILHLKLFFDV